MVEIKKLKSIETDEYSLEVYQCPNGLHIGLDASYLDQVSDIDVAALCNGIGPKGMQKHILIRDNRIIIPQNSFDKIERAYNIEWLNYYEKDKPFFKQDEYFITEVAGNQTPNISMFTGPNEGHRVVIDVYDQKTYQKTGEITAKLLGGKKDAMQFAKDLWSLND